MERDVYGCSTKDSFFTMASLESNACLLRLARKQELGGAVKVVLLTSVKLNRRQLENYYRKSA